MLGREVGLLNMREIRQEGILIHYEEICKRQTVVKVSRT
jgi:hypothetical protein